MWESGTSLAEVAAMATALPRDGAVARKLNPEGWWVTPEVEFMREVEHGLRVLAWQKTKDGQKGRGHPERILLPGEKKSVDGLDQIGGGDGFDTIEEMENFFAGDPWLANAA